jgi:esterase/lipase superfamily enzyme
MTPKTFISTILMAILATNASAADIFVGTPGLEDLVAQSHHLLSIDNVALAATGVVLASRSRLGNEDSSVAIVVQLEDRQIAAVDQTGAGHLAILQQAGHLNEAYIEQAGSAATALILQFGHHNLATTTQNANNHAALVTQQGQGNVAIISQR